MSLKLHIPENRELKPRLTVFGVGGAGGNAVNNMIHRSLEGVDFVVANTDAQALALNDASFKIQLGEELTEGLGAGAKPEVGAGAAEESLERIVDVLKGSHMCFITAGMGGGTGTGAAPVIAQAARELGILTIGVVTRPFSFEGGRRMKLAEEGIAELQKYVDTLIVIPNQNLFLLANEKTTFSEAFGMADDVLYQGVKGVTDLMVRPGLVNLDFADIRSVMDEMGKAMMGTGEAEGEDRAVVAAERAIDNPLLDEISLKGARGVLINITGGDDMALFEVDEASNKIREQVDPEANIIFGATLDPQMQGKIRVSVVATGIDAHEQTSSKPARRTETVEKPAEKSDDLFSRPETVERTFVPPSKPVHEIDRVQAEAAPQAAKPEPAPVEQQPSVEAQAAPAPVIDKQANSKSISDFYESTPAEKMSDTFATRPEPAAEKQDDVLARMQLAAQKELSAAPKLENEPAPQTNPNTARPGDRVRFGLESMIRRMAGGENVTGSQERPAQAPSAPFQPRQVDQSVKRAPSHEPDLDPSERERVDIPAFLRRQAN